VIAAGAWSARVADQLGVALPVHARKRDVFAFEADVALRDANGGLAPLVIDPSGVWFRPELQAGRFLCGAPPRDGDPDDVPLDQVDRGLFDEVIWPVLATRVPAFDALRVTSSWAGYYEMNSFDHNGLVGELAPYRNAYTACGPQWVAASQSSLPRAAISRSICRRCVFHASRKGGRCWRRT
jgi:glycine/D-amino acid oxidase-like deaminating enzyme